MRCCAKTAQDTTRGDSEVGWKFMNVIYVCFASYHIQYPTITLKGYIHVRLVGWLPDNFSWATDLTSFSEMASTNKHRAQTSALISYVTETSQQSTKPCTFPQGTMLWKLISIQNLCKTCGAKF